MLIVDKISHRFGDLPVLDNVSFQVADDEILAVIGPSGCGKSTLLNIISGIETPDMGNISGIKDSIAFVFQDDRLLPWKTVWENISLVNDKEDKPAIEGLIYDVGLEGFEKYKPDQLSGGMKKRCSLARAFYYKSEILLMDEPFQGLDYFLRQEMLKMLMRLWTSHKKPVLFITHEIDEALTIANRIIILSDRPTTIIKEIQLPSYEQRNARGCGLNKMRKEILSIISV